MLIDKLYKALEAQGLPVFERAAEELNETSPVIVPLISTILNMRFSSFRHAAVAASLFRFTAAQNSVPTDLKGDGSNEIQVSYTGEAQNGFRDGTSFTKDRRELFFSQSNTGPS